MKNEKGAHAQVLAHTDIQYTNTDTNTYTSYICTYDLRAFSKSVLASIKSPPLSDKDCSLSPAVNSVLNYFKLDSPKVC